MKTITKTCLMCGCNFEASLKEHNRGNAKYCSKECSNSSKLGKIKALPNVECALCGEAFHLAESKQAKSKSGLFFCCRDHKDLAQRIGGIKQIQPSHYGEAEASYRDKAFKHLEHACDKCGYNRYPQILEVHHKDVNRDNNDVSNLQLLCSTCHDEIHFLSKTGKWAKRT